MNFELDPDDVDNTDVDPEAPTLPEGDVTVRTRRGNRFKGSDPADPVITHEGVKVTADHADRLVEESKGLVQVVADKKKED